MQLHWKYASIFVAALSTWLSGPLTDAQAQCDPRWLESDGIFGVDGLPYCYLRWDPDGPGPRDEVVVIGGSFTRAGNVFANSVVLWDGQTWTPLGSGITNGPGTVTTMAVLADNRLVVAGSFGSAGGAPVSNIAVWDGSNWSPFGEPDFSVYKLLALPTGGLIMGGGFSSVSGVPAVGLAHWDGAAWHAIGDTGGGYVHSLTLAPNGDLIAGGTFKSIGGVAALHIARRVGSSWQPLGPGVGTALSNDFVTALAFRDDGNLVVGGHFSTAGGTPVNSIALWDGHQWSAMGQGVGGSVYSVVLLAGNEVFVGGDFHHGLIHHLAHWDGMAWSRVGMGSLGSIRDILPFQDGTFIVHGSMPLPEERVLDGLCSWTGTEWVRATRGQSGTIRAFATLPDGRLAVGGMFGAPGIASGGNVATWDGAEWALLGAASGVVSALAVLPNGHLAAGGSYQSIGGVPAKSVAVWDGSSWSPLGNGLTGSSLLAHARALAVLPSGELVVAGEFVGAGGEPVANVARWDGQAWHPMGAGLNGVVYALCVLDNGDLIAGGGFTASGTTQVRYLARWNSSEWTTFSAVPGPNSWVRSLTPTHDGGGLLAGGQFGACGSLITRRIARWDGAAWSALGAGMTGVAFSHVNAISILTDGSVVAGGYFSTAGGVPVSNIARWDGLAWSRLSSGLRPPPGTGLLGEALALATRGNELIVGGDFGLAGGTISPTLARWLTACCGTADFDGDGDAGTDADIEAFFRCLAGDCCPACFLGGADFNGDGDAGTDGDIESFFRVLAGGPC
jgi:trimeric autotransporter adhesin